MYLAKLRAFLVLDMHIRKTDRHKNSLTFNDSDFRCLIYFRQKCLRANFQHLSMQTL